MNEDTPIRFITKVGPKYEALLNRLGVFTIKDLLYHFPYRYDDFSTLKNVVELQENETATIKAELLKIDNIFTRNKKKITKAVFRDDTGEVHATWFNQFFIKDTVQEGEWYYLSGRISLFNKKKTIIVPTIDKVTENTLNTGRLVPIYPETLGVTSKWIRAKIDLLLNGSLELEEFLPNELLEKHSLPMLKDSLLYMHFPENNEVMNKAKTRFAYEELLLELINIESRKKEWGENTSGIKLEEQDVSPFISSLPFTLTESQAEAINEIVTDLHLHKPMNRLLEGDVGTGKTIIAIVAALYNYLNGYKTLYMAPTEILANQHVETFKEFLKNLDIKIELITGNKKGNLEEFDILIGTHAILFNLTGLDNIGLIIIDEQHRFGVEQRAKITKINSSGKTPNILTMTATPIPRTMALTLYGDLEISKLKTAPNKDKKITTRVVPMKHRLKAYEWVNQQNEPTFIVCPFIDESEHEMFENVKAATKEFEELSTTVFKSKKVGLLHGKMKNTEKDQIVEAFRKGDLDILVSTPVIEVGIDIPEAGIIVIESAERYGLASLHQLRGRVGRGKKEGVCLVIPSNFSKTSYERLKYLESISSGLELAEIDMKLRGHGDIYGTMQSGFKRFKVATLSNLELLEKAKEDAREYYSKLDQYPKLKDMYTKSNSKHFTLN